MPVTVSVETTTGLRLTVEQEALMATVKAVAANDPSTTQVSGSVNLPLKAVRCIAKALSKNTYVRHLDLRDCGIDDEGAVTLFDSLRHNRSVEELDLGNNQIGPAGYRALIAMLQHNQTLRTIWLCNNEFRVAIDSPPRAIALCRSAHLVVGISLSGEELFRVEGATTKVGKLREQVAEALGVPLRKIALFEDGRHMDYDEVINSLNAVVVKQEADDARGRVAATLEAQLEEEMQAEVRRLNAQIEIRFYCAVIGPGASFREW
eukprot:TRINITY_DN24866_c0_g1_i1.p1 TRINITY_DN24866_c0_g1~~TRINITY_DN24866_c0_g1_i1.p1  ORF type:complete len:263 (+),score=32.39 TRINITY_DN24866_c0_g1_i1:84-872(+)